MEKESWRKPGMKLISRIIWRLVQGTGHLEQPNPASQAWWALCLPETMSSFSHDRCIRRTLPQLPHFSQYLHPPLLCIWKVNSFKGTVCICILFSLSYIYPHEFTHELSMSLGRKHPSKLEPYWWGVGQHCSGYSEPVVGSRAIENTSFSRCLLPAVKCWVNSEV